MYIRTHELKHLSKNKLFCESFYYSEKKVFFLIKLFSKGAWQTVLIVLCLQLIWKYGKLWVVSADKIYKSKSRLQRNEEKYRNSDGSVSTTQQISRGSGKRCTSFGVLQTVSSGYWRIEEVRGSLFPSLPVIYDLHRLFRWFPTGWTLSADQYYSWEISVSIKFNK